MFKNTANTSKICILNAYDFKYIDISKVKNSNFLKPESGSEKDQIYLQIVNPLHEKWAWPFKKLHGKRQEYLQAIETKSKYKWANDLGLELQSASNLHRDKK